MLKLYGKYDGYNHVLLPRYILQGGCNRTFAITTQNGFESSRDLPIDNAETLKGCK